MENRNFKIKEANVIYLLLAIVFITFGASVQAYNINLGLLITEYIIIFLPVIIFGKILGINLKKVLRLNKINIKTIPKIIGLAFFLMPIVAFFNLIPLTILSRFDKVMIPSIPVATNLFDFAISFFIIAISAGLCEEIFFRGLILNAYENGYNKKIGAIAAAVLFGVFHFNIQNLFGPIIIGFTAAYLIHLTDSIFPAMILHISNNGIAVIAEFVLNNKVGEDAINSSAQMSGEFEVIISGLLFFCVLSIVSFIIVKKMLKNLKNDCCYFKSGELFSLDNKEYTVIKNNNGNLVYAVESEVYDGYSYDMSFEKCNCTHKINDSNPVRITGVWDERRDIKIEDEKKEKIGFFAYFPLVFVIILYIYIFILQINYIPPVV